MAAQAPPLPPEIAAQQDQQAAQSVFSQQGVGQGQQNPGTEAAQKIGAKIQELDRWAQEMKIMLDQFSPPLAAFLEPIAQAGLELQKSLQQMVQRSGLATGSPVVPAQPPQSPAAGPPNPQGM